MTTKMPKKNPQKNLNVIFSEQISVHHIIVLIKTNRQKTMNFFIDTRKSKVWYTVMKSLEISIHFKNRRYFCIKIYQQQKQQQHQKLRINLFFLIDIFHLSSILWMWLIVKFSLSLSLYFLSCFSIRKKLCLERDSNYYRIISVKLDACFK